MINRRQLLQLVGASALTPAITGKLMAQPTAYISKKIPSSGAALNVIGMGSSRTFNYLNNPDFHDQLLEVLKLFFAMGGQMIDSSPMYGSAEKLLGELLRQLPPNDQLFAASKIWTDGEKEGIEAVETSRSRMAVEKMDLMQIHNLRDWRTHIRSLRTMKEAGKIDYIGITTSFENQYTDFEAVMRSEPLDFIQINYNFNERIAEKTILPLANEKGIAVIVNRPFQRGRLFSMTRGLPIPEFAQQFGCTSWAQFFLKFVVSHPFVNCAIPATSKPKHMQDNMLAQTGRLPTPAEREQMISFMKKL
jgi:diketogulonate reductase-like aldo/keto reductase